MKPSPLALILLILSSGAVGWVAWRDITRESREWERLLDLEGANLRPSSADLRLKRFRGPGTGPHLDPPGYRPPWRLLSYDRLAPSEGALLLSLDPPRASLPYSTLLAQTIRRDGAPGWSDEILVPAGMEEGSAAFFRRPNDSSLWLRLESKATLDSPALVQYYAITPQGLRLVRLETPLGRFLRSPILGGLWSFGSRMPPLEHEGWLRDLSSDSLALRLSALHLLAAVHRTDYEPDLKASAARLHPEVRSRILELRKSPDPWIREAAEAVPLDGSP